MTDSGRVEHIATALDPDDIVELTRSSHLCTPRLAKQLDQHGIASAVQPKTRAVSSSCSATRKPRRTH